ncbi:PilZ domain-containing protein [Acidithiobacillus marinus]|nr:PilZ domain-containing protein [Acidithiobacillus marinus]
MIKKPLYEHAQELFLSWIQVEAKEIPELLIDLRLQKKRLTLFREQSALTHQILLGKMTASAILIKAAESRMLIGQIGEKVLCVYYGPDQSLGFLSTIRLLDATGMHIDYPQQVWIRNARKNERFGLTVNMTAFWTNAQKNEPIYGQVMDISYGGFLGGMHMAAYDDGSLDLRLHEQGDIILLKSDHTRWRGLAELRRSALITQDPENSDSVSVPGKGFALLGFAFIFTDAEHAQSLAHFLEGSIEAIQ